MYEAMSEVKSHIRLIDGMTLNERFQYELEKTKKMGCVNADFGC